MYNLTLLTHVTVVNRLSFASCRQTQCTNGRKRSMQAGHCFDATKPFCAYYAGNKTEEHSACCTW